MFFGNAKASGCNFETALELWSDPAAFRMVQAEIRILKFHHDPYEAHRRLAHQTQALQEALFDRLRRGDLLSSSIDWSPASIGRRIILPPETYSLPGLYYDWTSDTLEAEGFTFESVQFFLPADPPRNIAPFVRDAAAFPDVPLADGADPTPSTPGTPPATNNAPAPTEFSADATYEHVSLGTRDYSLTPLQASIVQVLHEASQTKHRWVHLNDLRDRVGFDTEKISGLFRRLPAWRDLIVSDKRGYYRLNL